MQEGLGLQAEPDGVGREVLLAEDLRIRAKEDGGSRAARRTLLGKLAGGLAARIGLLPLEAVALHPRHHLLGKRVHHRRAHAVQTARVLVLPARELAARVQGGQHQLQRRLLEFLLDVDGDAAAVVHHGGRLVILVQDHLDVGGVAVDDLVDRVVDNLPQQVVVALAVGAPDVHAGPPAHRLKALQDLDVF